MGDLVRSGPNHFPHFEVIAVRGDTSQTAHTTGVTLTASDSVLTPGASSVLGTGNLTTDPRFLSQYCDGSRIPPEAAAPGTGVNPGTAAGWQVPPGISDATVPNPIFNLTPAATVDEGNNWVNIAWGPLSMTNPTAVGGPNGNYGGGLPLGNYAIASASSARARVAPGGTNYNDAPAFDFFDNPRKPGGAIDAGAVQFTGTGTSTDFTLSPSLVDFGLIPHGSATTVDQDVQVINTGSVALSFNPNSFAISCATVTTGCSTASFSIQSNTCALSTIAPGESCVVNIVFNPISGSQAARNAVLAVNPVGVAGTEYVSLTGHDTIATVTTALSTPFLTTTPASTVAITGTITLTNTLHLCVAAPCPAGSSVDAGPFVPTAITLSAPTGTGTFTIPAGGTCAVGTPLPAVPPGQVSSCTITITYTPPATGTLTGTIHLLVQGYGTAGATQPATIINTTYTAN